MIDTARVGRCFLIRPVFGEFASHAMTIKAPTKTAPLQRTMILWIAAVFLSTLSSLSRNLWSIHDCVLPADTGSLAVTVLLAGTGSLASGDMAQDVFVAEMPRRPKREMGLGDAVPGVISTGVSQVGHLTVRPIFLSDTRIELPHESQEMVTMCSESDAVMTALPSGESENSTSGFSRQI
jgi:hypothetical protein